MGYSEQNENSHPVSRQLSATSLRQKDQIVLKEILKRIIINTHKKTSDRRQVMMEIPQK